MITKTIVGCSDGVAKEGKRADCAVEATLSLKTSVSVPVAVLSVPLVLSKSAAAPTAVLESASLRASAPPPIPVLKLPVLSKKSERQPSPVFPAPVVRKLAHHSLRPS
jgi:hypothetical protein